MTQAWRSVWQAHGVGDPTAEQGPALSRLLAADGYNTGFGSLTEASWLAFVRNTCDLLSLKPGDSVFEVGCGAGAFLLQPYLDGIEVGGLDYSGALIGLAKTAMPDGNFEVNEAAALHVEPAVDVVMSCGVFLYFDSLDYAKDVIERMTRKATRAVGIFDIPDAETAGEALAVRQATLGGADAYAERYAGLDHLAYDRSWIVAALESAGLTDVQIASQNIDGYENSRYRFNVWGSVPSRGLA
jgi:SAM-dependent methyltransferase